ncbi:MAG: LysR substrate-binding domain-containing protein [Pseudomonadota bacterium]|nr:LysR family transcriptional regulator [Hyphomicrobiales bacterium]
MSTPYRALPSLQTLRCFEAAARLGSFSLAAEEMCITHSAVSHQIRSLEEAIGQSLFVRQGNRIALTVVGHTLEVETRRALDYLSQAYSVAHAAASPRREILNLAMQVGLAEHWLLPRLAAFKAELGGVGLRISSVPDLSEKCPEDTDIAILYGAGDIPGLLTERVGAEIIYPVCSPAFLARHPDLTMESMSDVPLLLHSQMTWNLWLEKAGLPITYPTHSTLLDDVALTVRGALYGQGIAMARSLVVKDYLERGELVRLFDLSVPAMFNYHIAWRSKEVRDRFAGARSWIINSLREQGIPEA